MHLTIKKFMTIDLTVLTVLAIIVDVIGYFASQSALTFLYVALSIPLLMMAFIRWNKYAFSMVIVVVILHAILYHSGSALATILYLIGFPATMITMLWFKMFPQNRIRHEVLLLTLYYTTGYLALFLFHIMAMSVLGDIQWITLLIRHSFNFIFGWFILWIISRQQDLLVDMKSFLIKQSQERKREEEHIV